MTKKIHEKKKVNVKLESGQTFLVASIEEMLQIANALVHLSSSTKDEKEKLKLIMLSEEAIKAINENQFISRNIGEDDEW
jgi:ssRNA-specific RNase YbeY (16S rRNA maturation enzyme)